MRQEYRQSRDGGEEDSPEYWYWVYKMGELEGDPYRKMADQHLTQCYNAFQLQLWLYEQKQRKRLFKEDDARDLETLVS